MLMILCLLLFVGLAANAADYYVSTSGDDSNPGTEVLPWRTIQKAADTVGPGDVVYVNPTSPQLSRKRVKNGLN